MDIQHTRSWFLGANAPGGFASLYSQLSDPDRGRLFILKGGPGSGKSTFMRAVSRAAKARGLAVEEILCSGDPDSLDAVCIPGWHLAYADGTAPHVLEPVCPGGAELYLNFSPFSDGAALAADRQQLADAFLRYRTAYAHAYRWIAAAGSVSAAAAAPFRTAETEAAVRRRGIRTAKRLLPKTAGEGTCPKRFLSALTCRGRMTLWTTAEACARRIITLDNARGLAPLFLDALLGEAKARGHFPIVCPDPMAPEQTEHLIFPGLSLAFLSVTPQDPYPGTPFRHLRLDAMVPASAASEHRAAFRRAKKLETALLDEAVRALSEANRLHGALEALYRPHTDFEALEAFTAEHIEALPGKI